MGSDSWVEDIAANHQYYFVAEGCLNETKRLSVYDPTTKKLVNSVVMSNDTGPKQQDSDLIVSNTHVLLDVNFREGDAVGKQRFNLTTFYNIEGPPSEWSDKGDVLASNTLAAVFKNDSDFYVAKKSSATKIMVYNWKLQPKNTSGSM